MTDHHHQEVADLIAMCLAGVASDEEQQYLQDLIAAHEDVRALWEQMRAQHERPEVQRAYQMADREGAWANIDAHITSQPRVRHIGRFMRYTAAACIVLAVGIYAYWRMSPHTTTESNTAQLTLASGEIIKLDRSSATITIPGGPVVKSVDRSLTYDAATGNTAGINTLWSPAGTDYRIVLSDGTEVWLNSMTTLRFPFRFTEGSREIFIDGEAFVKVAKDADKPFIVHLPGGDVHVLGTEFNVNTYDKQHAAVSLVQGAVRLQAKGQTALLKPGSQADLAGMQVRPFDQEEVLSWMQGVHLFNNTTLAEIVKVLPRWYGIKVVLDDSASARNRFSGYIDRNRPIAEFLKEIRATADADFYYEGDVLHFR